MRILSVALLVAVLAPVAQAQLPTVLHTETNAANGHTYHLLDVSNWTDAEAAAVALGGHLTTIDDVNESIWITTTFAQWGGVPRHIWIGLTDEVVEGTFEWVDGTPLNYTNWNWQEPNNALGNNPIQGEDYVTCYPGGEWLDLHDTNFSVWFPNLCGVVEIAGPSISLAGSCPGAATLTGSNMTAGGVVYVAKSLAAGSYAIPGGSCVGTVVPVASPEILFVVNADANGDVTIPGNIPAIACGLVSVIGFDLASCQATNTIAL